MQTRRQKRRQRGTIKRLKGGANIGIYVFPTTDISTQPNLDPTYKEVGIIHLSESAGISAVRGFGTGVANMFGSKGFDNSVIDKLRNTSLENLKNILKDLPGHKICNLRMEIENSNPVLIFHHMYGTIITKTQ